MKFFNQYCLEKFFAPGQEYADSHLTPIDCKGPATKSNHGSLHAIRKAELLMFIVNFFRVYASSQYFRAFCHDLMFSKVINVFGLDVKPKQLITELALICFACSLGRESEIKLDEYPEKYAEYRKNCVIRFFEFIEKLNESYEFKIPRDRQEAYSVILGGLGIPEVMDSLEDFTKWVMHIITLSHTLDVCRNVDEAKMLDIISSSLEGVVNPEADFQFKNLIIFVQSWLKSTGDQIIGGKYAQHYQNQTFKLLSHDKFYYVQNLLRSSPGIFFDKPNEKENSNSKVLYKMVYQLVRRMVSKEEKLDDNIMTNFALLIPALVKLTLSLEATNKFLQILISGSKQDQNPNLQHCDEKGTSALIHAVHNTSISQDVVKLLLDLKMDPNATDRHSKDQPSALLLSITNNSKAKAKLLLEYKASVSQNQSLPFGI